jgi:Flp pilus assembly protein TadB
MFEGKKLHEAVAETERRARELRPRLSAADRVLTGLGKEAGDTIIIFLALAILVAPIGLGLALCWAIWAGVIAATGSVFLGWVAGIALFAFLCRYVWGTRLQSAAKRAAAALVAARTA